MKKFFSAFIHSVHFKRNLIIIVASLLVVATAVTGTVLIVKNADDDGTTPGNRQIPVYQGMTITSVYDTATLGSYLGNGKDDFEYDKDNGNHNGHFKGDYAGKDDDIDEENPFPENSEDETIEEEIESTLDVVGSAETIYYATQNQDIYINIHINNPDSFEIMSFTLNGKKYSSYMFEDGSDMETIVLKYNVGNASGIVEYTIDAIKYVDGEDIKDVIIDGDKTVKAGVKTDNQINAEITNANITTNALSFNVNITDNDSLIDFSSGAVKAIIYDGESIVYEQDLELGDNSVSFESLKTNTLYQYAIVGYYDDFSGDGFGMNMLHKEAFYTDSIVLFDNLSVSQSSLNFGFLKNNDYSTVEISALKLYKDATLIRELDTDATEIGELLSSNTYTLVAEYLNGTTAESISIVFTTEAKATPEVFISSTGKTKDSLNFAVSVTDTDSVGAITKVELLHATEDTKVLTNTLTHSISGLLSDNTYTLRVTYSYDLDDGEGTRELTKTLDAKTEAKTTPTFSIISTSKTQNSISFGITENDADNVGEISKIELIHNGTATAADSISVREFENLLSDNSYTLKVTYTYDLNNGEGAKTITDSVELKTDAKTAPSITFDNTVSSAADISFGINEVDTDNIGEIIKIELLLGNDVISTTNDGGVRQFEGLLSNTDYTVRVTYKYNLCDGSDDVTVIKTANVKTSENNIPYILISGGTQTQTSVGFAIEESDASNIGNITKIELYHDGLLVKTAANSDIREFTGLLSNTEYTVKVTYAYNLHDGSGNKTETREVAIKTFSMAKPSIIFEGTDRTKTSVYFDFNIVDVNNIGHIERIELIKDGDVVSYTNDPTATEFADILSNTTYTVKVIYAYDLNDGSGVAYIEKSAEITTYAKETPEISIHTPTKSQTSVGFSITETDTDNIGAVTKIELVHASGTVAAENLNVREFAGLLSNNAYTVKVTYVYDLNDGEGEHTVTKELTVTTLAKATPDFTITNTNKTQTSLGFSVNVTDTDSVGAITKVELIHGTDVTTLESVTAHTISDLLSNNDYTIKVTYTYDLDDGEGSRTIVKELTAKTEAKATPEISVHTPTKSQTSVGFSIAETDIDSVGAVTRIELVHANGTVAAENLNVREFAGLLSNNAYTVKITYVYDLNDGEGEHTVTRELAITTDAKTAPRFAVNNESITTNSITAEYDIDDIDGILSYYKVELYSGGELVSESAEKKIDFAPLSYYTDYTVKFTYKYDLNDGCGEQISVYNYEFKTLPYIDVTECSIANTSAVSEGDTIFMQVKLDNPLNMDIESVVINGETYSVTGASSSKKIFVEIVYNGQFAGGDTYLKIDNVNAKIDGTDYTATPETELSDNVFINGKLEVIKIEFVNEEFEAIDWAFPSDTVYVLITLNNPTGYNIDGITESGSKSQGTVTNLEKLDDNHWYYALDFMLWAEGVPFPDTSYDTVGCFTRALESLSYSNDYITKTVTYSEMKASFYRVTNGMVQYVTTPDDLKNMNGKLYYELKNDIDLSGLEWQGTEFNGVFNGKGYSIKNMSFVGTIKNTDAYIGLFSQGNGVIQNVNIEEATIIANITADDGNDYNAYCGGLVGYANIGLKMYGCTVDEYTIIDVKNTAGSDYAGALIGFIPWNCTTTITNCTNSGSISGRYAGGLIGYISNAAATITNCTNSGNVSANSSNSYTYAGGLVSYIEYGPVATITNCTNSGDVSANANSPTSYTYAGGLIGYARNFTITNCTNNANVSASTTGDNAFVGGLVGHADAGSTITNCINSGSVSSTRFAGGLVGYIYDSTITNCTNSGDVSASTTDYNAYAGGLVGYLSNATVTITNCTNGGNVSASSSSSNYAGGLVGYVDHYSVVTISNCANSGSISSTHITGGLVAEAHGNVTISNSYSLVIGNGYNGGACTAEQLNSKEFYTETLDWSEDVWDFSELDIENGKYPTLKAI